MDNVGPGTKGVKKQMGQAIAPHCARVESPLRGLLGSAQGHNHPLTLGQAGTRVVLDAGPEFVLVALAVKAFAVSLLGWPLCHVAVRAFGSDTVVMCRWQVRV